MEWAWTRRSNANVSQGDRLPQGRGPDSGRNFRFFAVDRQLRARERGRPRRLIPACGAPCWRGLGRECARRFPGRDSSLCLSDACIWCSPGGGWFRECPRHSAACRFRCARGGRPRERRAVPPAASRAAITLLLLRRAIDPISGLTGDGERATSLRRGGGACGPSTPMAAIESVTSSSSTWSATLYFEMCRRTFSRSSGSVSIRKSSARQSRSRSPTIRPCGVSEKA